MHKVECVVNSKATRRHSPFAHFIQFIQFGRSSRANALHIVVHTVHTRWTCTLSLRQWPSLKYTVNNFSMVRRASRKAMPSHRTAKFSAFAFRVHTRRFVCQPDGRSMRRWASVTGLGSKDSLLKEMASLKPRQSVRFTKLSPLGC